MTPIGTRTRSSNKPSTRSSSNKKRSNSSTNNETVSSSVKSSSSYVQLNSSKKNKTASSSIFASTSGRKSSIFCKGCKCHFQCLNTQSFIKSHSMGSDNPNCLSSLYKCVLCDDRYFYNKTDFDTHLANHPRCKSAYTESKQHSLFTTSAVSIVTHQYPKNFDKQKSISEYSVFPETNKQLKVSTYDNYEKSMFLRIQQQNLNLQKEINSLKVTIQQQQLYDKLTSNVKKHSGRSCSDNSRPVSSFYNEEECENNNEDFFNQNDINDSQEDYNSNTEEHTMNLEVIDIDENLIEIEGNDNLDPNLQNQNIEQPYAILPEQNIYITGPSHLKLLKSCHEQDISKTTVDKQYLDGLKLVKLLMSKNLPMSSYNTFMKWKYATDTFEKRSNKFINITQLEKKALSRVYGESFGYKMKPKQTCIKCPSNRNVDVITYDIDSIIYDLLSDVTLNSVHNLIFKDGNSNDPFHLSNMSSYGEFNDCEYYRQSIKKYEQEYQNRNNQNTSTKKLLVVPIVLYMDETTIDSYGKLTLFPVNMSLMIYNRSTRNLERSWRTIAYIPPISSMIGSKSMSPLNKLNDFHYILSYILSGIRKIQSVKEGLEWEFCFKEYNNKTYTRMLKFPLAFVIGDGKSSDTLCGKYQSRSTTKYLCRDCDILLEDSDNPKIECNFHTMAKLSLLSQKELNDISYHKIHCGNAFHNIDFGCNPYGLQGATPADPCHQFNKGIPERLPDIVCGRLSSNMVKILDIHTSCIASKFSRQSQRGMPCLRPFKNGLTEASKLTANENIGRVFVLYIVFLTTEFEKEIVNFKGRKPDKETPASVIRQTEYNKWILAIEEVLILTSWVYKESHPKALFKGGKKSLVYKRMVEFMTNFMSVANRNEGMGLKIMKWHQLLHLPWIIRMFGSLYNVDSSRNESHHKKKKKVANQSQRRMAVLDFQTSKNEFRYNLFLKAIKNVGMKIDKIFEMNEYNNQENNNKKKINEYINHVIFNDDDDEHDAQEDNVSISSSNNNVNNNKDYNRHKTGSKFLLTFNYEKGTAEAKWLSYKRTNNELPVPSYVLQSLFSKLSGYNNSVIGQRIKTIRGFSEFFDDKLNQVYRACYNFRNDGNWIDWCMVDWGDEYGELPAQLLLFLDISSIDYELCDVDPENAIEYDKLNMDYAAIIHSANGVGSFQRDPAYTIFNDAYDRPRNSHGPITKISSFFEMENMFQMIDVESISKSAFVIVDQGGMIPQFEDQPLLPGNSKRIILIEPMDSWHLKFLNYDSIELLELGETNCDERIPIDDDRYMFEG